MYCIYTAFISARNLWSLIKMGETLWSPSENNPVGQIHCNQKDSLFLNAYQGELRPLNEKSNHTAFPFIFSRIDSMSSMLERTSQRSGRIYQWGRLLPLRFPFFLSFMWHLRVWFSITSAWFSHAATRGLDLHQSVCPYNTNISLIRFTLFRLSPCAGVWWMSRVAGSGVEALKSSLILLDYSGWLWWTPLECRYLSPSLFLSFSSPSSLRCEDECQRSGCEENTRRLGRCRVSQWVSEWGRNLMTEERKHHNVPLEGKLIAMTATGWKKKRKKSRWRHRVVLQKI